jgi:NAD(P)-dependent dehydrogenase (short-subunit alcohol dehydrogenase family)
LADTPEEVFDKVIAVNLKGYFWGIKYAVPEMLKSGGGSIINTASHLALVGLPQMGAYCASKHGVAGLTKAAALDYGLRGIRVNAIAPGGTNTQIGEESTAKLSTEEQEALFKGYLSQMPVGRFAEPEEIAPLVLFLASDESAMITGAIYSIDGGWTTH